MPVPFPAPRPSWLAEEPQAPLQTGINNLGNAIAAIAAIANNDDRRVWWHTAAIDRAHGELGGELNINTGEVNTDIAAIGVGQKTYGIVFFDRFALLRRFQQLWSGVVDRFAIPPAPVRRSLLPSVPVSATAGPVKSGWV